MHSFGVESKEALVLTLTDTVTSLHYSSYLLSAIDRIIPPPRDVPLQIPKICEYVLLYHKGELQLQMELVL